MFSGAVGRLAGFSFLLGVGALAADSVLYTVDPGHRAIIFDRFKGIKPDVYPEGLNWVIPVIQKPIVLDVRISPLSIQTTTGSKDLQTVNLGLRVLSRPNTPALATLYRKYGQDFNERILPGICNEVLKSVVAQYNAEELLTRRDEVSARIMDDLKSRATPFHLNIDDVAIIHLNFSSEFSKAIEDKQVAEQRAERAKYVVQKAEQERQALIIKSEGDAEAAKLVGQAVQKSGRGLIELRKIETARDVASTLLNGDANITYLPHGSNNLLSIPTSSHARPKKEGQ